MKEKFAFIIVLVIGSVLFMLENPFGLAVGLWAMAAVVIAAFIEVAGWLTARKSLVIVPVFGKPKTMPLEGQTPVEEHRATRRAESRIVEPASWADYVGPASLAAELRTLSRLISDPNAGNALGVEVPLGGILHGPPGSGKTLLARVLAGGTGRRLLAFDGGALTSMWRGESTQLIRDMFMQARDCTPCILFIDELDGVLPSRADLDQWGQDSAQRINQFLQELEGVSGRLTGVFVLGATNHLATIDSAVRSRLSYHVEIPLPDYQAREAILSKHFPSKATTTPAAMAKITEGLSGRTLRELCRIAGMIALSEHAEAVTADHFHRAVSRVKEEARTPVEAHRATRRAESRIVEPASWADYVGPASLAAELRTLSRLIFDPDAGNALGVEVPLGGILHGPPGSGKTLLARVLAGETKRSLLAFDGGALTSMWRGESTQLIRDMFMQARDCTPCILFIDELDGVLPSRASLDQWGQDSAQRINQFLQELEGVGSRLTGVFVLGATNHLATIDSAVRSRLSYHVEIPLPDYQAREAILSKHFPSKATTTPAAMAKITEGLSGRTLRELCRIAGMIALSEHAEAVTADHFHRAISRVKDTDSVG